MKPLFYKKSASRIRTIHKEIIKCNQQQHPHHIYCNYSFLFSEIRCLNLQDLAVLKTHYPNWSRKEQYILKFKVHHYSKQLEHLEYWLPILYPNTFTSQSTNKKTLEAYHFILENETTDSDYWGCGGWDSLVHNYLEDKRTREDWEDLKKDLIYWSLDQLDILSDCIVNGRGRFDQGAHPDSTLLERFDVLIPLLDIAKQTGYRSDIAIPVMDYPEFINEGPPKSKKLILAIAHYFDYSEDDLQDPKYDDYSLITELRKALNIARQEQ